MKHFEGSVAVQMPMLPQIDRGPMAPPQHLQEPIVAQRLSLPVSPLGHRHTFSFASRFGSPTLDGALEIRRSLLPVPSQEQIPVVDSVPQCFPQKQGAEAYVTRRPIPETFVMGPLS